MIYYFLLAVSIILAVCKSSLYNVYAKKNIAGLGATFRFNAVSYGVAAAIALIGMLVGSESISPVTVICALFYAIIVLSLQTVSITAMSVGTMSVTAICVMYGMIIPSLAGPIFWQETIGILQIQINFERSSCFDCMTFFIKKIDLNICGGTFAGSFEIGQFIEVT